MNEQHRFGDKQWGLIVAKAWADEGFKSRLLENPNVVLREYGIEIAHGTRVDVVEDSEEVRHFVLPPSPVGELLEEELSPSAGSDSFSGGCGRCGGCGCGGCRGCRGCAEF